MRNEKETQLMKIALLEDNPENSIYLQTLLKMEGYQVFPHPEGDSILESLQNLGNLFPYDAVIIDLLLPGTHSGLEVMHRMQQDYPWKPLPFIVLSALSQRELDLVRVDFPQVPIIRKPFKRQQLVEAIQTVVAKA